MQTQGGTAKSARRREYPFAGKVEFPVAVQLLGVSEQMRVRVVYEAKPEWEYFDELAGRLIPKDETEWRLAYVMEAFAPSDKHNDRRRWQHWDAKLSRKARDAICDAIDADCRRQDRDRRVRAGTKHVN